MKRLICLLPVLLFAFDASALTGREIVEISDRIMQGRSQASVGEITIKTRRWTRTMKTGTFMIRKEKKTFFEILAPKKDAGNRFLLLDQLMWHYVPKLGQTIKISPSMMLQSWMGSDFTNDDIVKESSMIDDYTHRVTGRETIGAFDCFRIEMIPVPEAAIVWGKMVYFARAKDYLPVRVEFYNEHGVMKKYLTYSDYRRMDDRVIPVRMRMQTVGKKDRYTEMKYKKVRFNVNIPPKIFTLQHLKRK